MPATRPKPVTGRSPDLAQRLIVGPTLLVAGLAIITGLFILSRMPPRSAFHAMGLILGAEAYTLVGMLFMFLGLRYTLGPHHWIDRAISASLTRVLVVTVILCSLIVAIALWLAW